MNNETARVRAAVLKLSPGEFAVFKCDDRDFKSFRGAIQKAANRAFAEGAFERYETQSFPALNCVKVWCLA